MKLYIAAVYTNNIHPRSSSYMRMTDNERYQCTCSPNILESYHYIHKQKYVDELRADNKQVFLDSGAFSAFTQGIEVDLPGYCNYIKRNVDIIRHEDGDMLASVLDGIGDAHLTYENQMAMESQGVRPLPCFHYGEDEQYLEWYVANYSYITLGGMVPISTRDLFIWLDRIWEKYLTDAAGRPKLKVHGFGVTTVGIMRRYPWYSVDSSSWVQMAGNGSVLLLPEAKAVSVSSNSPSRKNAGQHIDTMPPLMRERIERTLISSGVDMQRIRETYLARWAYNIWAFTELGKQHFKDNLHFQEDQMDLFA